MKTLNLAALFCGKAAKTLMAATVLLTSQFASAAIVNADFSNGFTGWDGEVIDNGLFADVGDIAGAYPANFGLNGSELTLTTTDDFWSVSLFQTFTLQPVTAGTSIFLGLDVVPLLSDDDPIFGDLFFAQLLKTDGSGEFIDLAAGGIIDISEFAGLEVELLFGIQDVDFLTGDTLTIDNLSIFEQASAVPAPATALLMMLGLGGLALRRRN